MENEANSDMNGMPQADIEQWRNLSKTNPVEAYRGAVALAGEKGGRLDPKQHEALGWIMYRFLKANMKEMSSAEVRKVLRNYLELRNCRPSLLHSMMLVAALNQAKADAQFDFFTFLKMWNIDMLREEDRKAQPVAGGRVYSSLAGRAAAAAYKALQRHPEHMADTEGVERLEQLFHRIVWNGRIEEWLLPDYAALCAQMGNASWALKLYRQALEVYSERSELWAQAAQCVTDNPALKVGMLLMAAKESQGDVAERYCREAVDVVDTADWLPNSPECRKMAENYVFQSCHIAHGIVERYDAEKKLLYVGAPRYGRVCCRYTRTDLKAGDCIVFRAKKHQGRYRMLCPRPGKRSTVLSHFTKKEAVVDAVDEAKRLIHVTATPKLACFISFDLFSQLPKVGDRVKVSYYQHKDRNGKKQMVAVCASLAYIRV